MIPTEILIHISAPSRVQDDATYRRQARHYLGFEAVRRHGLELQFNEPVSGSLTHLAIINPINVRTPDEALSVQLGDGGTTLDLDHVVLSPRPEFLPTADTTSSYRPLIRPSDSPSLVQNYATPHTAKGDRRTPLVQVGRTPLERPRTAPTPASPALGVSRHQRAHSDSWETPPSVVPDSQPSRNSLKHGLHVSNSFTSSTQSASPLAKRPRLRSPDEDPPRDDNVWSPLKQGEAQGRPNSSSQLRLASSQESDVPSHHPKSQIHPQPPPTSLAKFDTHITPSLAIIASKLPLEKYFCPLEAKRSLRLLERGHWRVYMGNRWPEALREKFWSFLKQIIEDGRAGWGVWCERYKNHSAEIKGKDGLQDEERDIRAELGRREAKHGEEKHLRNETVKVYCWGETVPYIYLMLFVGSDRKVKGSEAVWIDSRGKVVVRMS